MALQPNQHVRLKKQFDSPIISNLPEGNSKISNFLFFYLNFRNAKGESIMILLWVSIGKMFDSKKTVFKSAQIEIIFGYY